MRRWVCCFSTDFLVKLKDCSLINQLTAEKIRENVIHSVIKLAKKRKHTYQASTDCEKRSSENIKIINKNSYVGKCKVIKEKKHENVNAK